MRAKHADGVNAELDQFIVRTIDGALLEVVALAFLLVETFTVAIGDYVLVSARRPDPIVLRTLPRTVRELVLVRWPRTGSLRMWRVPR